MGSSQLYPGNQFVRAWHIWKWAMAIASIRSAAGLLVIDYLAIGTTS